MGAIRVVSRTASYAVPGRIENLASGPVRCHWKGPRRPKGNGVEIAENLKATGTFTGEDVARPPDIDFRTLPGRSRSMAADA